jgi:hypothetical protein
MMLNKMIKKTRAQKLIIGRFEIRFHTPRKCESNGRSFEKLYFDWVLIYGHNRISGPAAIADSNGWLSCESV